MPQAEADSSSHPAHRWAIPPLAAALILLALVVILFYWKLSLTKQYGWISGPDLATQVVPWFQVQARQWHTGAFPLWDPHMWLGQPLLGQAQPGAAYPLNWLLFLLPLRDGIIRTNSLKWYFLAIHFMAAVFAYALCRDLNRSRAASFMGACLFSFGAYMGSIDWPQMLNGAVWTPLILMFLLRAARGYRPWFSAAAGGAALGMAWLSGHHQIPIFASILTAGVWIYFALRHGRLNWRIPQLAAVYFVFTLLVGALQIVPAMEYGRLANRWAGAPAPLAWNQPVPYSVHEQYALPPKGLIGVFFPSFEPYNLDFIGVVAFSLALAGVVLLWRDPRVRIFSAIALAGLFYSLGPDSPLEGIIYSVVPWADKARTPSMAILFFELGAVVLAAYGIDAWSDREIVSPWRRYISTGALVFGAAVFAIYLCILLAQKMQFAYDDRFAVSALYAILLAALLAAWTHGRIGQRQALCFLALLLLADLGNSDGQRFQQRDSPQFSASLNKVEGNADIAKYLKSQREPVRIDIASDEMIGNFGDWYGIDASDGYLASLTANLLSFDYFCPRAKMLFGFTYTLSRKPTQTDQQEVFRGVSGIGVYRNPEAFPRVWSVHQTTAVENGDQLNYYLHKADFDLRRIAPMPRPLPELAACDPAADRVRISGRDAGHVSIDAAMACDGMVVLSETFYPGWKAAVDGESQPIRQVYGAIRGVVVKHGHHRLEMRYRPGSVMLGAALSFAGLAGLVILGFLDPRRLVRNSRWTLYE
ncbi:MAG: hypothetical protein ABI165_14510 [Bryobacteraceae bacterium]